MRIDFHYYAVYCLANEAGYSQDDAKTIAYASQYVDDSTDSDEIRVGEYSFDTVRTAHYGIESFGWDVQKKVFMPFHFLPPEPNTSTDFTYLTKPNSKLANMLINEALTENNDRELMLIRLGVALHTYADTWSHQRFSGRKNKENDVEDIEIKVGSSWKPSNSFTGYLRSVIDSVTDLMKVYVGHMDAYNFPDIPSIVWKYREAKNNTLITRDNPSDFLEAAHKIFLALSKANNIDPGNAQNQWINIENSIRDIIGKSEEKDNAISAWKDKFNQYFNSDKYEYDEDEWRDMALVFADASNVPEYRNSKFAKFHKAALIQRGVVMREIFL